MDRWWSEQHQLNEVHGVLTVVRPQSLDVSSLVRLPNSCTAFSKDTRNFLELNVVHRFLTFEKENFQF